MDPTAVIEVGIMEIESKEVITGHPLWEEKEVEVVEETDTMIGRTGGNEL